MAQLVRWSGNGLTAGTFTTSSVGSGDTAPDLVSGSLAVDASGGRSPQIKYTQAASANAYTRWTFASQTQTAFRFYFTTPSVWPSSTAGIFALTDGSGIGCRISIAGSGTPGTLRIYENPTASILDSTATNTLTTSTQYRIEGLFDQTAKTLQVKIFLGESDTPLDTLNGTSASAFGASQTRMLVGNSNTTPTIGTFYMDDIALDSGTTYISSPWIVASPPASPYDVVWAGDGLSASSMSTASVGSNDTLIDLVTGSTITIDPSGARSPRIKIAQDTSNNAFVRWAFSSRTQSSFQFYWTSPPSWPSAPGAIAQITDANGIGCRLSVASTTSPGRLRLYENPTGDILAQTQKNQLSLNTTYRIDGVFDQAAGTLTVNIHLGEAYETLATLSATSTAFGTAHERFFIGNTNTTPTMPAMYYDDIYVESGTTPIISPYTAAPLPAPAYDVVWNGDGLSAQAFSVATNGTGDTAADQVSGNVWVDDTGARPGRIRLDQQSGAGCNVRWSFAPRNQSSFRFYFTTPETWASTSSTLMLLTSGVNTGARIVMTGTTNPGALRLYETPTAGILDATAKNTIRVSTKYRVEGVFDQVAGTFEVKIYLGDTDMLVDTLYATSTNFGTDHQYLMLGNLTASPTVGTMYFDEIALNSGTTYLSTPYLVPYSADGDAWVKIGTDLFPVKVVAIKTTSGFVAIKRTSQALSATESFAPTVFLNASTANGSGTATLSWTLGAGSNPIDGVYIGRNGVDASAVGPWESTLLPGTSGLYTFANLMNGTTYTLYVDVVVGGTRVQRREAQITPTNVAPNYGGTTGWSLLQNINLTAEPAGTQYTTGVRGTDQSYNQAANASYGPSGMTITAARASNGATIYSSDVQMHGIVVPSQFAFEVDVTMTGLGAGRGPAVWFRPQSGEGELDLFEYLGGYVGESNEMKTTVIRTGANPYNQGSRETDIPKSQMGGNFEGLHRWRYELTSTQAALWVDGNYVGAITKAAFEAVYGAGSWAQFEGSTQWYPRFTFQINNGTTASIWGLVPPDWLASTLHVSAARLYSKN